MDIAWFGPMVPMIALLDYWYVPASFVVVILLVVLAIVEDQSIARQQRDGQRNGG